MASPTPADFHNWLPLRLFEKEGNLFLEWIYLWDVRFTKPFFDETLTMCKMADSMKGDEQKGKRITPIDFLSEVAAATEPVAPSLFIFHTSRCGSTLTTQVLSIDNENRVYAEYAVVDAILRASVNGQPIAEERRKAWLKNLVRIMGQQRFAGEKRLIVKLDSWHFGFHSLIRELFPDTPFAILFREPEPILRSNSKLWGMQFIPEIVPPSLFNLEFDPLSQLSLELYADRVLESMYSTIAIIAESDSNTLLLNYSDGILHNLKVICSKLTTDRSFLESDVVKQRLSFHSKRPDENFSEEPSESALRTPSDAYRMYERLLHRLPNL